MTDSPKTIYTQIEQVSQWITGLHFEDIPADVIELAQLQLLDAFAAIAAGSRSTIGVRLQRALRATGGSGKTTVCPSGEQWPIEQALYFHAAMLNALELDNFSFMGHISQSAVSVPLAIAEKLQKSGKELLLALVAAEEVAGRMSAHLATGPQQGHMRSFIHRLAGAVATAKLLELDATRIAKAIAVALSMPEFPLFAASFSPDTKVICTSGATVEGMRAAFMAKEGIEGALDILEHPVGFFAYLSYLKKVPDIWAHLGKTSSLYALSFKKYATCAYAQGPVNAALEIYQKYRPKAESIERLDIYGPIVTIVMEKFSKPHYGAQITPVNTQFSTKRSVLAALLFGELTGDFFQNENFESKIPQIQPLYPKTHLHHNWQQTINLIKGVDAGIQGAGKPGVLSFGSAGDTLKRFKKAFGSRPLIHLGDVPEILRLSYSDRNYLFQRFWKTYRTHLPFWNLDAREAYRSHEGDLRNIAFPLSGRIHVHLKNGAVLEAYCPLPPGFAGDPNRAQVVKNKYLRETTPVWGKEKAVRIQSIVEQLPKLSSNVLFDALKKK